MSGERRVRQRAQQRSVDDREEGGRRRHAQRQGDDGCAGERGLMPQLAEGRDEIVKCAHGPGVYRSPALGADGG